MQTCTEYWKIMVSRASGIWGDYYLTNIFLLSKYIKSVSKQLWFAAAICIIHNPLASYFSKWENTDFFIIFLFFFKDRKIQMLSGLKQALTTWYQDASSIQLGVLRLRKHPLLSIDVCDNKSTFDMIRTTGLGCHLN